MKIDDNYKAIKKPIIYSILVLAFFTCSSLFLYYFNIEDKLLLNVVRLITIVLLFLPLVLFKNINEMSLSNLGLKFNWRSVIATIIIVITLSLLTGLKSNSEIGFITKIIEGIARTGEELFFRGFVYLIILVIFKNDKNKNLIAILLSSLIFTIAHTQIFLGLYHLSFVSMLFNTIITFGLLRYFFNSILPVVAVHTFMNGGITSCIIGLLITTLLMSKNHYIEKNSENLIM